MDLVVKLMMKTGQFSNDLNTAKTQIQGFKQGFNDTANAVGKVSSGLGGLMKNLASFNGYGAALAGTFKAFKFGVQSSQSYTDLWGRRIGTVKGYIEQLAVSMATLDFNAFKNGFLEIGRAARDATDALDNLWTAGQAYSYLSGKYSNKLTNAYNIINDLDSTQEQKDTAYKDAQDAYEMLKEQNKNYTDNVFDAVKKLVAKETGGVIDPSWLTLDMIDETLKLLNPGIGNNSEVQKEVQKRLNNYNAYRKEFKKAAKDYSGDDLKWKREQISRSHIKDILYRAFSENITDDELKQINELLNQAVGANDAQNAATRIMNRIKKRYLNPNDNTGSGSSTKEIENINSESIKGLRKQKSELEDVLINQKASTKEWSNAQKELDDINLKIKEEEQNIISALEAYYGVTNSKSMISDFKAILANQKEGTEEWEATNTLIQAANNGLEKQENQVKDIAKAVYGIDYKGSLVPETQGNVEPNRKTIAGLSELISKETNYLNSLEAGTDEWEKQYNIVFQLKNELAGIQNLTEKINLAAEYKKLTGKDFGDWTMTALNNIPVQQYKQIISVLKRMREEYSKTSEEYKKFSDLILLYQERVDAIVGKTDEEAPGTDKWDSFISAMSQTSTIVSNLGNAFNTLASESSSSLEEVSASMALMTKNTATNSAAVAAAILQMVSTTLPAISAMIGSISVLAGVEATEKAVSTSKHWIEAIAAVVAIAGTVASAIASAKKLGNMKFATGGIVPGNSYTGDRVVASVNSGEMILNKRQQNTLFRAINSGSIVGSGMNNEVQFKISGTDLVGVLNNNTRKQGLIR